MRKRNVVAVALALAVAVSACTGSSTSPSTTAGAATAPSAPRTTITVPRPGGTGTTSPVTQAPSTAAAPGDWRVDTSDCPDPDAARAPITGMLTIAMSAPLSGGVAAARWAPVVAGMRTAIDHANFTNAFGELRLDLRVVDDRLDPDRTEDALQAAIDAGAQVVAAVVGTDTNLAARFTLNEQCIPQLLALSAAPQLADVVEYPWTAGFLPPVTAELGVVATQVTATLPSGGTLGVYAAEGVLGDAYVAAAGHLAATTGLAVVATERIGAASSLPATAAIQAIVAARPDVVLAAPDGLDCTWFLRGLGAERAAAPDWRPLVVVAAGCALPAAMRLAGPLADGVLSTAVFADAGEEPSASGEVAEYLAWMQGAGLADVAAGAVPGWSAGQALVGIVRAAEQSADGLSRAALIDAARHLDAPVPLGRPGVMMRTDGTADPDLVQSMQIVRWNAAAGRFDAVGPVVTSQEA